MKESLFSKKSFALVFFFNIIFFIFLGFNFQLKGACRGEGFLGISSKDPIMSWVDLTFSPVYTSASTSGTSGCKNWDFPYEKYMEYVIRKFIKNSEKQILIETVQGYGSHIDALSLMTCPQSSFKSFKIMLREHSRQTINIFINSGKESDFLNNLKKWIKDSPQLKDSCWLS